MGGLKGVLLGALLLWPVPAAAGPLDRWKPEIAEASARFDVPAEWIRRVMRAESGGRLTHGGRPIVSPAGAMGLMQLMPGTWREMRVRYRLGTDPHDPRANILAGTAYLRLMYDRFGYPGLFAAYNAGPARYARHLAGTRRLPRETLAYLAAVTKSDASVRAATRATASGAPLFAVRYAGASRAGQARDEGADELFALRPGLSRRP